MLTPSPNPALSLELPQLTTSSIAHPDTWNPTHQALLDNDAALHQLTEAIQQAQQQAEGQLTGRLDRLETVSAVGTQRAVTLDWLYRRNTIQFELWQPGFTLTDSVNTVVTSGVPGDDSLDLESTAGLKVGESYLLSAAEKPTHLIKLVSILNEHRVRIEKDLPADYTGGQLRRTTMQLTAQGAQAQPGDSWLSRKLQASGSSSVIIRMLLNAAKVRLFWRDDAHDWTEAVWTARRAIEEEPDYSDFEYNVGGKGNCWLRLDVEGEPVVIKHLVVLGENTGLGGYVNQDAKPHAPVMIVPADASTAVTTTPTLSIDQYASDSGISMAGVRFQLATDAEFTATTHDSGWSTGSLSYGVPADTLEYGETYHVRARVRDKAWLESDWSATVSFQTESVPIARVSTPSIVAPASNALGVEQFFTIRLSLFQSSDNTTELTHSATQVQIRNASDRWADALWDSGSLLATQSVAAPGSELQPDATYAIRARYQSDESGWSEWSADSAFTTAEKFASDVTGIALVPIGTGWNAVRIDENHAQYSIPNQQNYFDSHPVFGGIHDALINGQHMVRVPKFYYRRELITLPPWQGQVDSWLISPTAKAGFELHPAFMRDGVEQDELFIGKYVCSLSQQGHLQSVPGTSPILSSIIGFKRNANGWGSQIINNQLIDRVEGLNTLGASGFDLLSIDTLSAVQMLCFVEHATFDVRHSIAPGHTTSSIYTDVDSPANIAASYRGITGLWGNVWQYVHSISFSVRSNYSEYDVYKNRYFDNIKLEWPGDSSSRLFSAVDWTKAAFLYNFPKSHLSDQTWSLDRGYTPANNFPKNSLAGHYLIVGGQWDTADRAGLLAARGENANDVFGFRLTKFNDK